MTADDQKWTGFRPPPRLLQAARTLVNLSREELAERAGVSKNTVRRYEQGAHSTSHENFLALFRVIQEEGVRFLIPEGEKSFGLYLVSEAPSLKSDPLWAAKTKRKASAPRKIT